MDALQYKRFLINVICTLFLATLATSCRMGSDSFLVVIYDASKCSLKRYSFEMPEMTASFSADQLARFQIEKSEPILYIPVAKEEPATFKYKMRAEYENCAEVVSQEMEVKRGYVIYESIRENKINHEIRAK